MLKLLIFEDKYCSEHKELELLIIIILKSLSLLSVSQVIKGVGPGFYFVFDGWASGKNSSPRDKSTLILGLCCHERLS